MSEVERSRSKILIESGTQHEINPHLAELLHHEPDRRVALDGVVHIALAVFFGRAREGGRGRARGGLLFGRGRRRLEGHRRRKIEELSLFDFFFFALSRMASSMLLRPSVGTTPVASTSYGEAPALPRRHSRRAFVANATSGDGQSDENNDDEEQANRKRIAAKAAAAAAASLLAVAQPATASEHPQEGGWRHGLRPRRHLRAMGDFERDRLLRVRMELNRKKRKTNHLLAPLSLTSFSTTKQKQQTETIRTTAEPSKT